MVQLGIGTVVVVDLAGAVELVEVCLVVGADVEVGAMVVVVELTAGSVVETTTGAVAATGGLVVALTMGTVEVAPGAV